MDDVHRNDAPVWWVHVVVYAVGRNGMIVNAQVLCEACNHCTRFEVAQDESLLRIFDGTEELFIFYCKHLDICMNAIDIWRKQNEHERSNNS